MIRQRLTALDVLNIFIEQHRLCSPLDIMADPSVKLSFDTTIDEWRESLDLLPWKPLSDFLNKQFNIQATYSEWKSVLEPSHKITLGQVCILIAEKAIHEDIRPINLLGVECLSAAIFLTLKKYLKRRNVDVKTLRPSTLISPYLEKHFSEMIEQISIISKGQIVFDQLQYIRKKSGFLNAINIFDKDRYRFLTGDILTFRDVTNKVLALDGGRKS